jgi:nicotinate-nucleotide adenylyltransferase
MDGAKEWGQRPPLHTPEPVRIACVLHFIRMSGTLCFGGSFNPIHHGHLICAVAVAEAIGAERIRLIPSGVPPHKVGDARLISSADRFAMTQLAVAGDRRFQVDAREIQRSGPSYTIDTIRELRAEGVVKINWLIGADMLNNFPTWREPEAIIQEANVLVVRRPGHVISWETLPSWLALLHQNVIVAPLIDISATTLRHRVTTGLPIDYFTPSVVARYIAEHGLYRSS